MNNLRQWSREWVWGSCFEWLHRMVCRRLCSPPVLEPLILQAGWSPCICKRTEDLEGWRNSPAQWNEKSKKDTHLLIIKFNIFLSRDKSCFYTDKNPKRKCPCMFLRTESSFLERVHKGRSRTWLSHAPWMINEQHMNPLSENPSYVWAVRMWPHISREDGRNVLDWLPGWWAFPGFWIHCDCKTPETTVHGNDSQWDLKWKIY